MRQAGANEMLEIGIVQHPNDVLSTATTSYELSIEAAAARSDYKRLQDVATYVFDKHESKKGLGVAAPQIGIARRIAIFRQWRGDEFCLLNPRIIAASTETDVKYEGCLSLFDVRGLVRRPLSIIVEAQNFEGDFWQREFVNGDARLICHEIDHLDGHTYLDRLQGDLISVSDYRKLPNTNWIYRGAT